MYNLSMSIRLSPMYNKLSHCAPLVVCKLDNNVVFNDYITENIDITVNNTLENGVHDLILEFNNKLPSESGQLIDKAVQIEQITFNSITSPRFIWLGEYIPQYPEPWYSEQLIKPEPVLTNSSYLGWNGSWKLQFSTPIFTWIHKVENFGWIYN